MNYLSRRSGISVLNLTDFCDMFVKNVHVGVACGRHPWLFAKIILAFNLLPDSPKFSWSHSSSKCRHFSSLYAHRCGMWLRAGLWESHTRHLTGSALKERVFALIYPFLLSDCNVAPLGHPVNLKWWLHPRMVAGHRSPDFSLTLWNAIQFYIVSSKLL